MIGVFDSGFGGLSVVKEISRQLPGNDIVYYADTANFPYGCKKEEDLRGFIKNNIDFLRSKGATVIVVACNTASSLLDGPFRDRFDIPIIDVVSSGIKMVGKEDFKDLGLIATESTIDQGILTRKLEARGVRVFARAAQDLVDLAQNRPADQEAEGLIRESLKDFESLDLDGLYLGCTHYPLIGDLIYKVLPTRLIDPAVQTARDLGTRFASQDGPTNLYFYSSKDQDKNKARAKKILGQEGVVVK